MRPVGCEQCRHTGYKGRMGIFEIFVIDDEVRHMINNRQLDPVAAPARARARHAHLARRRRAQGSRRADLSAEEVISITLGDERIEVRRSTARQSSMNDETSRRSFRRAARPPAIAGRRRFAGSDAERQNRSHRRWSTAASSMSADFIRPSPTRSGPNSSILPIARLTPRNSAADSRRPGPLASRAADRRARTTRCASRWSIRSIRARPKICASRSAKTSTSSSRRPSRSKSGSNATTAPTPPAWRTSSSSSAKRAS